MHPFRVSTRVQHGEPHVPYTPAGAYFESSQSQVQNHTSYASPGGYSLVDAASRDASLSCNPTFGEQTVSREPGNPTHRAESPSHERHRPRSRSVRPSKNAPKSDDYGNSYSSHHRPSYPRGNSIAATESSHPHPSADPHPYPESHSRHSPQQIHRSRSDSSTSPGAHTATAFRPPSAHTCLRADLSASGSAIDSATKVRLPPGEAAALRRNLPPIPGLAESLRGGGAGGHAGEGEGDGARMAWQVRGEAGFSAEFEEMRRRR
ncbi:unnamed protein product, partial [Closterium sp. NIES-54]